MEGAMDGSSKVHEGFMEGRGGFVEGPRTAATERLRLAWASLVAGA